MTSETADVEFRPVVNDAGQYSIWETARPLPRGWRAAGDPGTRQQCLEHVSRSWTDIRPQASHLASESLLDCFERSVRHHGERTAVSDAQQQLSYHELDRRSSVLAIQLAGSGVGLEDRVVLYLERGIDLLVAMLGVLKAGAAYVAVDARYPDARRDLMMTSSGAGLVLATPGWAQRLQQVDLTVLEWESSDSPAGPDFVAPVRVTSTTAACVLFTSGSSGTPKAIVLEHHNLVSFADNPALPRIEATDRTAQVSSISFDAFHFEVWCSLVKGAEIVILPSFPELLAGDLQRELRRRRISVLFAPTMAINHVMLVDRNAFTGLRMLCTGGDVILPAAVRDLLGGSFTGEFVNMYGPSETTTACTLHRMRHFPEEEDTVPIGTVLDGVQGYVLDAVLQPVPAGQAGQLYVGGGGVGRGYLNDPTLTADRFRPDPFTGTGTRMYATGDLVRTRPDGLLEFLGRADDQVKIRGYRVEPRETERTLCRNSQVRDAVVMPAGEGNDRRLVAFVVPYDTVTPKELRAFACEVLPDFMVPSEFIIVSAVPGDDHGKRDLGQLNGLLAEHQQRRGRRIDPDGATQKYLADLWEDLLGLEHIGAGDDFFELGGHSLLAFRAQRAVERDLGVRLSFRDILDNGVLHRLASVIDDRSDGVVR